MESEPGHEAVVISTKMEYCVSQDGQCKGGDYTHLDSTNPLRFLSVAECSPFSPYFYLFTLTSTTKAQCRPKDDQNDGKECGDDHRRATGYTKGVEYFEPFIVSEVVA